MRAYIPNSDPGCSEGCVHGPWFDLCLSHLLGNFAQECPKRGCFQIATACQVPVLHWSVFGSCHFRKGRHQCLDGKSRVEPEAFGQNCGQQQQLGDACCLLLAICCLVYLEGEGCTDFFFRQDAMIHLPSSRWTLFHGPLPFAKGHLSAG